MTVRDVQRMTLEEIFVANVMSNRREQGNEPLGHPAAGPQGSVSRPLDGRSDRSPAGAVALGDDAARPVSAYVGGVSLICVMVILNIFLVMSGVVQERKDKVLLFVLEPAGLDD